RGLRRSIVIARLSIRTYGEFPFGVEVSRFGKLTPSGTARRSFAAIWAVLAVSGVSDSCRRDLILTFEGPPIDTQRLPNVGATSHFFASFCLTSLRRNG